MSFYDNVRDALKLGTANSLHSSNLKTATDMITAAEKEAKKVGRPITGYKDISYSLSRGQGFPTPGVLKVPIFGMTEAERVAPLIAQQEASSKALTDQFNTQQADIASQLKILQTEKDTVKDMSDAYTQMLKDEADRRAEADRVAQETFATKQANLARSGLGANLQIQPAGQTPKTAGTQAFKIRQRPFNVSGASYGGLSKIKPGNINI